MLAQRRSWPWAAAVVVALVPMGGCGSDSQGPASSATQSTHSTDPTYSGMFGRAALSQCKADVATVSTAEEAFYAVHGPPYSSASSVRDDLVDDFLHSWPADTTMTYTRTPGGFTVTGSNHGQVC